MFRFHRRQRSLISVKDMDKSENMEFRLETNEVALLLDVTAPRRNRNLTMIYLLFLAEAIMVSSLSSQIAVLVPSTTGCMTLDTSFLRSLLDCAYFLGSTTGVIWGCATDRVGRRSIALLGLSGMSVCCVSMGFATTFLAVVILRVVAGAISSAVTVAGLAMLADATHGSTSRTKTLARLPMVAVGGSIGPLAANSIRRISDGHALGMFAKFPGLGGQVACAAFVLMIALGEALLLEDTLPQRNTKYDEHESYQDCEKAAFLGQSDSDGSDMSLDISIVEALNDDAAEPFASRLSIAQTLAAPSVLVLLASFAVFSLHSSAFEILLPHLGHTASHKAGMGILCSWLGHITLLVKGLAALLILHFVPLAVSGIGLLRMYQKLSVALPVLYIVIPLAGLTVSAPGAVEGTSAVISVTAMLAKDTLAGSAHVLVLLLALSAAPDALSTGTVIGVLLSVSQLFEALAIGITGTAYYLPEECSMLVLNTSMWAVLTLIALLGAGITWKLRETPRVGMDIPENCLGWQGMFDVESDEIVGF